MFRSGSCVLRQSALNIYFSPQSSHRRKAAHKSEAAGNDRKVSLRFHDSQQCFAANDSLEGRLVKEVSQRKKTFLDVAKFYGDQRFFLRATSRTLISLLRHRKLRRWFMFFDWLNFKLRNNFVFLSKFVDIKYEINYKTRVGFMLRAK